MSSFIYDLVDAWNDAGTTFTGIKLNVTDTASHANSLLMDLQVGGVSRFYVTKNAKIGSSVISDPAIEFGNQAFNFSWYGQFPSLILSRGVTPSFRAAGTGGFEWTNGEYATGTVDLMLRRDAADTLALRRAGNAQKFNIYETFTDASNYSRGYLSANSTAVTLGSEAAGTGTKRNVVLDGLNRATYSTAAADIAAALVAHGIMAPGA